MKLGYTILYVPHVQEAIEFYETAFGLKRKFIHESGLYGELDTGATTLSFAAHELIESNGVPFKKTNPNDDSPAVEIAFVSENIDKDYDKSVTAGAIPLKKPELKPWGQTVGYVKDLNGFLIEICSPIK